jgi:hypothetical protein
MVNHGLNLLQMDKVSQQDTKLIPTDTKPTLSNSLEANYHIFQVRPIIHSAFCLDHNKNT